MQHAIWRRLALGLGATCDSYDGLTLQVRYCTVSPLPLASFERKEVLREQQYEFIIIKVHMSEHANGQVTAEIHIEIKKILVYKSSKLPDLN